MSEKLHKVLARTGLGSRREIEKWIEQGRVTIDGQIAHVGVRVGPNTQISVDGKTVSASRSPEPHRVIVYNKPEGQICTRFDPQGRPTVYEHLPPLRHGQWISVGRLDINTSGLLIFTTDGELAQRLMHPRYGIEREYLVRAAGELTKTQRRRLIEGITVDGRPTAFKGIRAQRSSGGVNRWYRVVITQGRYREVRRLFGAMGISVNRLKRLRFGCIELPKDLAPGGWSRLSGPSVRRLLDSVELVANGVAPNH